MATFGKATDGTGTTSSSVDRKKVMAATPSTSGTVTSISIRGAMTGAGSSVIKGVIYADSAGSPGALLAVSDEIAVSSATEQEWVGPFSGANLISVTGGTTYHIGWIQQAPGFILSRNSTNDSPARTNTDTYSDGPTDPFGTATDEAGPVDVYVTYTEGGGGGGGGASLVQAASNFNAINDVTPSATLPGAATAGNLLVWITSGDKDMGTFTQPSGFTVAVYLHTANVSLAMCWKSAAGGETAIAGSQTGSNSSGSETWVAEYSQAGSGAWQSKATVGTTADSGSNVTSLSTGTTGTIASAGLAIAAWAVDSTNTEGTSSYSNSYVERKNPLALGDTGESGLWVAELAVAAGGTTSCTLTRTGGVTADQMCGGVMVLGRTPVVGNKGGGFLSLL